KFVVLVFFLHLILRSSPSTPLFPYTTLFRSQYPAFLEAVDGRVPAVRDAALRPDHVVLLDHRSRVAAVRDAVVDAGEDRRRDEIDRKSTRLNSSHVKISYAVFCLKKKI